MSWALLREAQRDSTLGARQMGRKMVLIFLARRAEDSGIVKVGGRVVANETGIDHRRVRRLLHELEEMGRIDLVAEGAAGRGRAHTWRVLCMAEWDARRRGLQLAEPPGKGAPTPPIRAEGKGGVETPEKGASPPPLEHNNNTPLPPTGAEAGSCDASVPSFSARSTKRAPTPAKALALPGLGRGEEGLGAIGRARAAGKGVQARRELEERERRRREDDYEERASSPEAMAARQAVRERWLGRRAAGAAS